MYYLLLIDSTSFSFTDVNNVHIDCSILVFTSKFGCVHRIPCNKIIYFGTDKYFGLGDCND